MIIRAVVVALEAHVLTAEVARATRKDVAQLSSHDFYVRAIPLYLRQTVEATAEAIALLRCAITLDPGHGRPLATLAFLLQQQMTQGWVAHQPDVEAEVVRLAHEARAADGTDPFVLAVAAFVSAWLVGDHEMAADFSTKAAVAGEHLAVVLAITGSVNVIGGQSEQAISQLDTAMRLDPTSPAAGRFYTNLAGAHLFAGRFEQAARWARRGILATPDYTLSRLYFVAALSLGDNRAAAEQAVAEIHARQSRELPHLPGRMQLRHSWMGDMLDAGVRQAGLAQ
jgi:adenylate cyclase